MAQIATLTISGTISGLPSGTAVLGPLTVQNFTSGPGDVTFASAGGDNTVAVPPGGPYVGAIVCPPAGNTNAIRLKGAGGDTGVLLHPSNPAVISLGAGVTTFVLNVAAGGVVIEVKFF